MAIKELVLDIESITTNTTLSIESLLLFAAHYAKNSALQDVVLYNKTTWLSQVELVWFGKDEEFSFEV